mgnify:CR=1 FL=1
MNTIKLKIGQNSISNSIVKSKYTQNINASEVKNLFGDSKLIDDYFLKGGYKVVSDIDCRNNISCEYRKLGMQVMVVGPDASFKKYVLKGNDPCSNEGWEELITATNEIEVKLVEDYSVLGDSLNTQRDLNLKLKQLILNLQTQIDLIELSDEKVQITEDTSFANVGQSQKDFNKNASDYKINSDLKNQEQDDRLTDIEDENAAQNDLINDLSSKLDFERTRNDAQDSVLRSIEEDLTEKLDKGAYTGDAQDLKNEIDTKQKQLSSFDESILIETDGNIEGNISLFEEYFEQQECELNFTPIQIVAVYQDGIRLSKSEYEIILPKKIKIKEYVDENIQIEYTHLKS